jgi:hypothetical protein
LPQLFDSTDFSWVKEEFTEEWLKVGTHFVGLVRITGPQGTDSVLQAGGYRGIGKVAETRKDER